MNNNEHEHVWSLTLFDHERSLCMNNNDHEHEQVEMMNIYKDYVLEKDNFVNLQTTSWLKSIINMLWSVCNVRQELVELTTDLDLH